MTSVNEVITSGFEDEANEYHHGHQHQHPMFTRRSRLSMFSSLIDKLQVQKGQPVVQYHETTVYREDLDNLRDNGWLNDNNISFLYEYLEQTLLKEYKQNGSIVLLRPSMAYLLLHTEGDPALLEEVLPPLKSARFIFLPINDNPDVEAIEGGWHWSLLVVSMLDRKALYYDTLQGANHQVSFDTAKKLAAMFRYGLNFVPVTTPQQVNYSDCGVLVCQITAILVRRLIHAKEGDSISLGLKGLALSPYEGRTFMLTTILELISEQRQAQKVNKTLPSNSRGSPVSPGSSESSSDSLS
jgi:sentrin-specific protease 8